MTLMRNLAGVLPPQQIKKIQIEVEKNVRALLNLASNHYQFSKSVHSAYWRQKVSRLYYAAYNARRALMLKHDGTFSTDSSDHKNVDKLPDSLANCSMHKSKLKDLREDRNLCDYSHLALEADLLIAVSDADVYVEGFLKDVKDYLASQGMTI
jgi:uncharacterized protein (UPF0332 family)